MSANWYRAGSFGFSIRSFWTSRSSIRCFLCETPCKAGACRRTSAKEARMPSTKIRAVKIFLMVTSLQGNRTMQDHNSSTMKIPSDKAILSCEHHFGFNAKAAPCQLEHIYHSSLWICSRPSTPQKNCSRSSNLENCVQSNLSRQG